jgi:glutamyl-tRNA reductase
MNKSLRYISISHKTASVTQREEFHIPEEEKSELVTLIYDAFPDISGLLLLVTCNRTEIYFESEVICANTLLDFIINLKTKKNNPVKKKLFDSGNSTEDTVRHLLKVTSGLASSVLGDAEIVHQIKKAYQFSIAHKTQGSLLERAMQTVFKSHKRISNETHFRDGTTSVAYKSLKVISNTFDQGSAKSKKILFIGAGDIVKQLFKYNSKFDFTNIRVSNRTEETAKTLAKKHNCKVFDWQRVLTNDFEGIDVIVSAASNCPQLVKSLRISDHKVLLIDLALPSNIDKNLAGLENILLYDLDSISVDLEETKEKRFAAIGEVGKIITEELVVYNEWLQGAPLRAFLSEHKIIVNQGVKDFFGYGMEEIDDQKIKLVIDRIMRKLRKQTNVPIPHKKIEVVIAEETSLYAKHYA